MVEDIKTGIRLHLHVQPGGKKSEILGEHDGALKIRVQAPPVEGKANAAVIEFVAEILAVPRSRVTLIRGEKSRHKVVEIEGLTRAEALAKLP